MENCKVKIFFGMSGALKLTTINSMYSDWFKVYSDTKPFYEIDEKYLNWSSRFNDGALLAHRLLTLDLDGFLPTDKNIAIERGISDNIFCIPNRGIPGLEDYSKIKVDELVELELSIINKRTNGSIIEKELLVMEDDLFVSKNVLNDKYRKSIYPDLYTYRRKQDEYVEFTQNCNSIDKVTVITNAMDYINKLKAYGR